MLVKWSFKRSRKGQGLAEYAVVIALVALVCIIIIGLVGLAATRNYGLVAGALGAKKQIDAPQNFIRFDNNPPQCGLNPVSRKIQIYAQFFSDITQADVDSHQLTVATDTGLIPDIVANDPLAPPGVGNWTANKTLLDGQPCPTSLVIQFPISKGGGTVAYTVLQKDFP